MNVDESKIEVNWRFKDTSVAENSDQQNLQYTQMQALQQSQYHQLQTFQPYQQQSYSYPPNLSDINTNLYKNNNLHFLSPNYNNSFSSNLLCYSFQQSNNDKQQNINPLYLNNINGVSSSAVQTQHSNPLLDSNMPTTSSNSNEKLSIKTSVDNCNNTLKSNYFNNLLTTVVMSNGSSILNSSSTFSTSTSTFDTTSTSMSFSHQFSVPFTTSNMPQMDQQNYQKATTVEIQQKQNMDYNFDPTKSNVNDTFNNSQKNNSADECFTAQLNESYQKLPNSTDFVQQPVFQQDFQLKGNQAPSNILLPNGQVITINNNNLNKSLLNNNVMTSNQAYNSFQNNISPFVQPAYVPQLKADPTSVFSQQQITSHFSQQATPMNSFVQNGQYQLNNSNMQLMNNSLLINSATPNNFMNNTNMNQTVTVNTPQGAMVMHTVPSKPNELPQALILPDGQIVPVVTQPNLLFPSQQCIPIAGSYLVPNNSKSSKSLLNNSSLQQILPANTTTVSVNSFQKPILSSETKSKKKSNGGANKKNNSNKTSLPISMTAVLTPEGNVILSFPQSSSTVSTFSEIKPKPLQRTLMPKPSSTQLPTQNLLITHPLNSSLQNNFALGAHPFSQNPLFPNIVQMQNQLPIIHQPQAFIHQPTVFTHPQNFASSAQTFNVMNNNSISLVNSSSVNSSVMETSNIATPTMTNSLISPKKTLANTDILAQATQTIFTAEQPPLSLSLANQPPLLLTSSTFEKPSTTLLTTNSFYQSSVCSSQQLSSNFSLTTNNFVSTLASDMMSFYTPSLVSNKIDTVTYQENKPKRKRKKRQPKVPKNLPAISSDVVLTTSNITYNKNNNLDPNNKFLPNGFANNAQLPQQDGSKTTSEAQHDSSNTSQNSSSAYPEQSFMACDDQKEQVEKEHQGVEEACMDGEDQPQDITDFSDLIRMHPMTPRPTYDWQSVNTPVQHCPKSPAMSTPVFNSNFKKSLKHELGKVGVDKESDFGVKLNNGEDKGDHCGDEKSAESKDSNLLEGEMGLFDKLNPQSTQDSHQENTEAIKDPKNNTDYLTYFLNNNTMTNKDKSNVLDNNINSNNIDNSVHKDTKSDFCISDTNNETLFSSNINQFELTNSNNLSIYNEEDKFFTVEKADKSRLNNVKSKKKVLKINEKERVDENTNCFINSFESEHTKSKSFNEKNKQSDAKKVKNKKFFHKDSGVDDGKKEHDITGNILTKECTNHPYLDESNENKIKKTIERNGNENRMIRKNRGERRSSRNKNKTKSDPYAFNDNDDDNDVSNTNKEAINTMRTTNLSAMSVSNVLDFNNTNTAIDFSKNYNDFNQNATMNNFNTDLSRKDVVNSSTEVVKKGRGRRKKNKLSEPLSPGSCQEYVISVEKLEAQNKDGDEDEDDDEGEEEANVSSLFTHEENEIPFEHQAMQIESTQTAPVSKKRKKKERKRSGETRKKLRKKDNDNLLEGVIKENASHCETNLIENNVSKQLNGVEAGVKNEVNISESTQTETKRSSHKHKKKRKHDTNEVSAITSNEDKEQTYFAVSDVSSASTYGSLTNIESRLEPSDKYTDSGKVMDAANEESTNKNSLHPSITMKIRKEHQNYKVQASNECDNFYSKDSHVFNDHQEPKIKPSSFIHAGHDNYPQTSLSSEGSFPPSSFYSYSTNDSSEIQDSKRKDILEHNQCDTHNNDKQEASYVDTSSEVPQMHSISTDTSGIPGRSKKKRKKSDKKSKNNGNKSINDDVVDKQSDDLNSMNMNSTLYENALDDKIYSGSIQEENDKTNKFVILKQPKITKSEEKELTDVSFKENVPNANNNNDIYNYSRKNTNFYETVLNTQLKYSENVNKETSIQEKAPSGNTQPFFDPKKTDYFTYEDKGTADNTKDTTKVKAQHTNLASLAQGMSGRGGGAASKLTSSKHHDHSKKGLIVYF